ncbi:hypothetical protein [Actinoplanes sp. M2I2]|uniref:hypothetical protein n=1 Tax=Actinoplanes sp. M2I2 TaxID=1734444 RepID=UPI002020DEAA|nr:hypothetical protein [Actinoplanes sp. M2I2]
MDSSPPPAALDWIAETTGGPVTCVRRLAGGTHAATHLIGAGGDPAEVVLRRFPSGDPAAAHEARVLTMVDGLGGLAPRLLAADPSGVRFGEPTVLT